MESNYHLTQDDLSGYALGALDPEEIIAVEEHLSTCTDCQVLLAEFQSVAAGMAFALPPQAPPVWLRERLAESIAAGKPVALTPQPRFRFSIIQLGLALATVAAIALLVANIILANRISQIQQQNSALIKSIQQYQENSAILFQPGVKILALTTGQVRGNLVISPDDQTATLFVEGLSPLDPQHTYQVWLIPAKNAPLSVGLFQISPDQQLITFPIRSATSLKTFAAIGVTVEPMGGSSAPTTTPILLGKF